MTFAFEAPPMATWPGCMPGLASSRGQATRKEHVALFAARDLRLVYAGWSNAPDNRPTDGPLRVKASIEYPAGNYIPVHFANEEADGYVIVPPDGNVVSLPCNVAIPAGQKFFSNTSVVPTTEGMFSFPVGRNCGAVAIHPPDSCTLDTTVDYTLSPQPAPSLQHEVCYIPVAICGTPLTAHARPPIVGILGDSIAQGAGGLVQPMFGKDVGYIQQACQQAGIGYVNFGIYGDTAADLARRLAVNLGRLEILAACTDVVVQMGTNDLYRYKLGRSAAPFLISNLQTIWKILADQGVRVWQPTLTPKTLSTDRFTTLENQTPWGSNYGPEISGGSPWSNVNAYIRTKPKPLAGIIDVVPAVGVLNSHKVYVWQPGCTTDGTHPNPEAGHPSLISLVPVDKFGRV